MNSWCYQDCHPLPPYIPCHQACCTTTYILVNMIFLTKVFVLSYIDPHIRHTRNFSKFFLTAYYCSDSECDDSTTLNFESQPPEHNDEVNRVPDELVKSGGSGETRKILYLHHFINNMKPFAGKAADPNALTSIANLGAHSRILGLKHMRYSYWCSRKCQCHYSCERQLRKIYPWLMAKDQPIIISRGTDVHSLFSTLIYRDSFFNLTLVLLQVFYKVATHKQTAPFLHFSGCDLNQLVLIGPCFEIYAAEKNKINTYMYCTLILLI